MFRSQVNDPVTGSVFAKERCATDGALVEDLLLPVAKVRRAAKSKWVCSAQWIGVSAPPPPPPPPVAADGNYAGERGDVAWSATNGYSFGVQRAFLFGWSD